MFESFFDRLLSGDTRSWVVLVLLVFVAYLVIRFLRGIITPYQGYLKLLLFVCIALLIYGLATDPDRIATLFSDFADWITGLIDPDV